MITYDEPALCEDTLKKEGASDEEVQDELNIILTQQAYTQQRRGKETAEIYEKVLKTKYVTFQCPPTHYTEFTHRSYEQALGLVGTSCLHEQLGSDQKGR